MKSTVTKTPFGKLRSGAAVDLFTLNNKNGIIVKVTNYGATIILYVIFSPWGIAR